MKEVAFRVLNGSPLYLTYFAAKDEKNKFVEKAHEFFQKHDLVDSANFRLSSCLSLELNPEQRERFKRQLRKYTDSDGLYCFRKRSPMQTEWEKEVVSHINQRVIDEASLWFWPYITKGRYSLWDYNGVLYGYLSSNTDIKLTEGMELMKLSEYYAIAEELDGRH